eukprot:UN17674
MPRKFLWVLKGREFTFYIGLEAFYSLKKPISAYCYGKSTKITKYAR